MINENKLGDGLGGWDIMLFNNKPNNPTDEDDDTFVKKQLPRAVEHIPSQTFFREHATSMKFSKKNGYKKGLKTGAI